MPKLLILSFIIFSNILFADSLESLLKEYEIKSDQSYKTINEKIGHVTVYTQEDLKRMQYNKLSDILKELPVLNLSINNYGIKNLAASGNRGTISTSMRLYINDHEVSSVQTMSPFLVWDELPLDFISHIEIYHGDGSFSLGNESGLYVIKIYTKSPKYDNGGKVSSLISNKAYNTLGATYSKVLDNGWSYLLYTANQNIKYKKEYKNNDIKNSSNRKYLYLNLQKDKSQIDFAYAGVKKDNFLGLSRDANPDEGEIKSKDYFLSFTNYFLEDDSIKTLLSIDINQKEYTENNKEGILLLPVLNPLNLLGTMPKSYKENLVFEKYDAFISKTINSGSNKLLTALSLKQKVYKIKNRETTNFSNVTTYNEKYSEFNKESLYSFMLEDIYEVDDDLYLLGDVKFDRYIRNESVENSTNHIYKIGSIYMPTENFGVKFFHTKSYVPPTFYFVDYASKNNKNLKAQKFEYNSLELIYSNNRSKFTTQLIDLKAKDLVTLNGTSYSNNPDLLKGEAVSIKYDYQINLRDSLHLNYYLSDNSYGTTASNRGGSIKYIAVYKNFDYFTSLFYKKGYELYNTKISDGYDLSLGATYNFSKNLCFSIKGESLLNKAIKSLYADYSTGIQTPTYFTLDEQGRRIYASIKWLF